MELQEKTDALIKKQLCDFCLGRQFARLGHGMENDARGRLVQQAVENNTTITENIFTAETELSQNSRNDNCEICQGICQKIDQYAEIVVDALEPYEYTTFLIGTRVPMIIQRAEEELWEEVGIESVEPLKSELNRRIGKIVHNQTDKTVAFSRPDITIIFNVGEERAEIQLHSLFIYGRYSKLQRGIPQTKWPCRECDGIGCNSCEYLGKRYRTSVEELISIPLCEAAFGIETKFHGAGREDVDAICYAQRPFVIEIIEPELRSLNLQQLQKQINADNADTIAITDLQFTNKDTVQEIKGAHYPKTYRIRVNTTDAIPKNKLTQLRQLESTISQQTPERVAHRRANRERQRTVHNVNWEQIDKTTFDLYVTAEAGTYLKELVTGDNGNTQPNVATVLGTQASWETLDVMEIHTEN